MSVTQQSLTRGLLFTCGLALVVHLPSVRGSFVFDDHLVVETNARVHGLDAGALADLFTGAYWPGHDLYYRPLLLASFALNHAAGGLDPTGYRLVNVFLHVIVVGLLTALGRRVAGSSAGVLAGALFAVHPLVTEPVYWISARSDLLATASMLGASLLAVRPPVDRGAARVGLAAALVTLVGLLSKESAVLVPLLVVLAILWRDRYAPEGTGERTRRGSHAALLGSTLALGIYAALRIVALGGALGERPPVSFLHNPLVSAGPLERALTPFVLVERAAALVTWPQSLSSDYTYDAIPIPSGWGDPRVLAGALAALLFFAALFVSARRGGGVLFGLAFAAIAYVPASNTIVLGGALFGERFLHASMAGVAIAVGAAAGPALGRLAPAKRRAAIGVVCLLLLAGAARSMARGRDWRDDDSLYASALRASPGSAQAHYNVGVLALGRARDRDASGRQEALDAADASFHRALAIYPRYAMAEMNVGVVAAERGSWERALISFERAHALAPGDARVHYNLGRAYEAIGDGVRAREHYRESARILGGGPGASALDRLEGR